MPEPETDALLSAIEQNTRDTADAAATTAAAVGTTATTAAAVVIAAAEAEARAAELRAIEARTGRRQSDVKTPATIITPSGAVVAAPTSTEEQDRHTAGQRAVNMMWESTQRQIALAVIVTASLVAGYLSVWGMADSQTAAMVFLFGVANLITGFYFGRTNHQRVGGVQQGQSGR